jgi:starch synthase
VPAKTRLRICLTSSEISPLAKTGGLADVTSALAAYFARKGHDCRVLVPFYAGIETDGLEIEELPELADLELQLGGRSFLYSIVRTRLPGKGPELHLLRCPELYFRREIYSGPDEHLRFILLSRAAIEMCQRMQFAPDIFHCHDWHTALVPAYLKTRYAWDHLFADTRTVLTIHNIGYQGVFGAGILYETGLASSPEVLDPEDLHYDRINFLKTGIVHADLLTTVSPTHAREILEPGYGMGLDGWLRNRSGSLIGILNGIDYAEWNPRTDEHIPHHFSARRMAGKERNKQAVMQELGLEYHFDRPLLSMVTRLTYQKGIDLIQEVLPNLLKSRDFSWPSWAGEDTMNGSFTGCAVHRAGRFLRFQQPSGAPYRGRRGHLPMPSLRALRTQPDVQPAVWHGARGARDRRAGRFGPAFRPRQRPRHRHRVPRLRRQWPALGHELGPGPLCQQARLETADRQRYGTELLLGGARRAVHQGVPEIAVGPNFVRESGLQSRTRFGPTSSRTKFGPTTYAGRPARRLRP